MKHILWINESADRIGGCERYIEEAARDLHARFGVRSTLLYRDLIGPINHGFARTFQKTGGGIFPLVEAGQQVPLLSPDLIFVHRLSGVGSIRPLALAAAAHEIPLTRFFHDYQLFCPREHKYTTFGRQPCEKAVGGNCLACLGFIRRAENFPGIALRSIGQLQAEQRENRTLLDASIVASAHMAREVRLHGFEAEKVHVLPLYARPDEKWAGNRERESNHLLFVGQLITGKGVDTLLHAVTLLPEVRLTLAGGGRCEAKYRRLAEQLGIQDRVYFAGRVNPESLRDLYQRATCVVMPSRFPEPFGLVGVEAMQYGTPVIASGVGGMTEWLQNGETGLSINNSEKVNDPAVLAATIERLLLDPTLAARLGVNARQHYLDRFQPEHHVRSLYSLFSHLIAARQAASILTRYPMRKI